MDVSITPEDKAKRERSTKAHENHENRRKAQAKRKTEREARRKPQHESRVEKKFRRRFTHQILRKLRIEKKIYLAGGKVGEPSQIDTVLKCWRSHGKHRMPTITVEALIQEILDPHTGFSYSAKCYDWGYGLCDHVIISFNLDQ